MNSTEKLRKTINEIINIENLDTEVSNQIALSLDTLIDIESEYDEMKKNVDEIEVENKAIKADNERLRKYNSQLVMKLGSAIIQNDIDNEDNEENNYNKEVEEDFDDFINNYNF